MACIRDAVPVGVLRERITLAGARTEYDVLGLAVPVAWRDGYFFFESVGGPEGRRGDTPTQVLLAHAEDEREDQAAGLTPPADDYDARRRIIRQIVERRGQRNFRQQLLTAYGSACAVTGYQAPAVLEAAHLLPYRGPASNVVTNGLLLRADVHTLLDLQLIAFETGSRQILVSKQLAGTEYAALQGSVLAAPTLGSQQPDQHALKAVLDGFLAAEVLR